MNKILYILTILLVTFVGITGSANAKLNLFVKPRYIPNLSIYTDSGKVFKLSENKSELLITMVWSRYCGPCIGDLHHLQNFAQETKDDGIQVIIVSPESEWKSIDERQAFLRKVGASQLQSYTDKKSNFIKGMGIMATPTTIMVNNQGEEVGQITGASKWDDEDVINYLLKLKESLYSE